MRIGWTLRSLGLQGNFLMVFPSNTRGTTHELYCMAGWRVTRSSVVTDTAWRSIIWMDGFFRPD
jgi:hypothetical protein